MHSKSVSDSMTQCNMALKLCGQSALASEQRSRDTLSQYTSFASSPLLVFWHEPLSISYSLRWAVRWSEHLTPLTAVPITTWPDTSYQKCTFTLWILVVGLWDNVLAAGGLQDGALERRKQKLPPSRQSQFQPDAYKVKHLQGFRLCKCSMLKIGIYLLEWLTLLHWYISQLLHIYLMNAVRYFTYKRP